jgi:hypothetical protein
MADPLDELGECAVVARSRTCCSRHLVTDPPSADDLLRG